MMNRTTSPITPKQIGLDLNPKSLVSSPTLGDEEGAYKYLRSLSLFSALPEKELKSLAHASRFMTLTSGQYLTNEGDQESLYGFIVISGRLAMMKTSINGKELVVELLAPGDILGLLVMLSFNPVVAQLSVRAQAKSRILLVPIIELTRLLNTHPVLYKEFVTYLLGCLQSSYRISRGLAHDRVEVRIATVLLGLALKFANLLPTAQAHTINITRQQLADLTGTTIESAIRITRTMQQSGIIDIKRPGIVRVKDMKALQEIAEA